MNNPTVKRRVFVLSELYYPAETGTGFMMGMLAEGLATRFPVYVLCGYPEGNGEERTHIENRNGVIVERCAGSRLNKEVLWSRSLNLLTISISIFFKALLRFRRGDKVLVVTNPPSLPFFASAACKLRGAKCFLLIYDLYPEVLTTTGFLHPRGFAAGFLSLLNTKLYEQMERVILLGRDMYTVVAHRLRSAERRAVVIPNWADVDEIVPMSREENLFLRQLNISDKFVIQHAGNMGRTHGLETLVESAHKLQCHDAIHFLCSGTGAKRQWLTENVKTLELRNFTLLPLQPRCKLCELLNACDVAVISFIPGMAGISVPSRMYSIMAAGKPIIAVADDNSELALVVREEEIGWVVRPDRPDLLAEVITQALEDRDLLHEMGKRARRAAEEKYSFGKIISRYQDLFTIE